MPILPVIVISIIAFVTIFLTVPRFRRAMINYAQTAWYYLAGTWNDMNIPHPTWEQARHALFVLLMIILGFLATGIALWGIIIAVMSFFGNMVNAPIAGFLIGLLGFILLIIFPRRSLKIIVSLMVAVFLLAVAHFSLGVFDPKVKKSVDRKTQNWKQEIANSLDKRSLKSEAESGMFAQVTENTILKNRNNQPLVKVEKEYIVRVTSLEGKKTTENSEVMLEVMLRDKDNGYSSGLCGFLPVRVLDLYWMERERKEKEKPKPPHATSVPSSSTPVATAAPIPKPVIIQIIPTQEKKDESFKVDGTWTVNWENSRLPIRPIIKKTPEGIELSYSFVDKSGQLTCKAIRDKGNVNSYKGNCEKIGKRGIETGEFFIQFNSPFSGSGYLGRDLMTAYK